MIPDFSVRDFFYFAKSIAANQSEKIAIAGAGSKWPYHAVQNDLPLLH
jgi:hypothetical protein